MKFKQLIGNKLSLNDSGFVYSFYYKSHYFVDVINDFSITLCGREVSTRDTSAFFIHNNSYTDEITEKNICKHCLRIFTRIIRENNDY